MVYRVHSNSHSLLSTSNFGDRLICVFLYFPFKQKKRHRNVVPPEIDSLCDKATCACPDAVVLDLSTEVPRQAPWC